MKVGAGRAFHFKDKNVLSGYTNNILTQSYQRELRGNFFSNRIPREIKSVSKLQTFNMMLGKRQCRLVYTIYGIEKDYKYYLRATTPTWKH